MITDKSIIKKILVFSLSNIGDVVLTFPVIDVLKQDFPEAQLSVVVGPKGEALFQGNPLIHKLHIFDKHQFFTKTFQWLLELRKEHFDLVVDLRNTAIPLFLNARHKTSPFLRRSKDEHMRWQHLNRLRSIYPFADEADRRYALNVRHEDKRHVDDIIKNKVGEHNKFVVINPGAADERKRWTEDGFSCLCDRLIDTYKVKVVLVGNTADRKLIQRIVKGMSHDVVNLSGQTTLIQLAHLFRRSTLLIVNDTGTMHLASYLDVPVLVLFGYTDPHKYGPWGSQGCFIKKDGSCPACQTPRAGLQHQCLQAISTEDVFNAFELTSDGVVFK